MTLPLHPSFVTPLNGDLAPLVAAEVERWGKLAGDGRPNRHQVAIGRARGTLSLSEDWIELDFPAPRRRPRRPDRLLLANAGLPGNARYVARDARSIRLRGDVPLTGVGLHDAGGVADLLRFSLAGLAKVLDPRPPQVRPPGANGSTPELAALCQEAGWAFTPRSEGQIQVDLDVSDNGFFQAEVTRHDGVVVLRVDPLHGEPPSDSIVRRAVAALLLTVSGSVRMVSAVAEQAAKGTSAATPGLRVALPAHAPAGVLGHALAALSSGCSLAGRESRALAEDPALAKAYLEVRHPRLLPRAGSGRDGRPRRSARSAGGRADAQP